MEEFLNDDLVFTKRSQIEKICLVQTLPQLLATKELKTLEQIVKEVQQELLLGNREFHVAVAQIYRILIADKCPVSLIETILSGLRDDPVILDLWLEILLESIEYLNRNVIVKDVLPKAISLSQSNRVNITLSSCRILGRIASHPELKPFHLKKDVLPTVLSLCQDFNAKVRSEMCSQLPVLAKGLNFDEVIVTSLLPILVELSSDEVGVVQSSAIKAIAQTIPSLKTEILTETIIPLIRRFASSCLESDEETYNSIAEVLGVLLQNLQDVLKLEDWMFFLEFYGNLSKLGVDSNCNYLYTNCRRHCAFNLPVMTKFFQEKLNEKMDRFYEIVRCLCRDRYSCVRKIVAGTLHEIITILGCDSMKIKREILGFFHDDVEVFQCLIPHLAQLLRTLQQNNIISKEETCINLELTRALLECQKSLFSGNNWRVKTAFLKELEVLPECMSSDFIYCHYCPVVLKLILQEGRAKPVKNQAVRTLLVFLRKNTEETQRQSLRESLTKLCFSNSFYTRLIFLQVVQNALELFSKEYFRKYFLENALKLAEDKISNMRLCFAKLLPELFEAWEKDDCSKQKFEDFINNFRQRETDKDVKEVLEKSLLQIKLENEFTSLLDDHRKLKEEKLLGMLDATPQSSKFGFLTEEFFSSDLNITDDLKANLLVKSRGKTANLRTKRYSSIFVAEINTNLDKTMKRRSLNIQTSDFSRIPVSCNKPGKRLEGLGKTCQEQSKENVPILEKKCARNKPSGLPVFVK